MSTTNIKREFPCLQMSPKELENPANRSQFDAELRKLKDLFPHLTMNPLGVGREDRNHNSMRGRRGGTGAGGDQNTTVDPDLKAPQDIFGDLNWTYRDRSYHGQFGLFAFKDIKPGETVIRKSHPLASVPDTPKMEETCSNCFLWAPDSEIGSRGGDGGQVKLKTCTGCRIVRYCGKQCQLESWKEVHKYECKAYKSLQPWVLPNNLRLLVRLFFLDKVGATDEELSEASPFQRLESHLDDFKNVGGKTWEQLCLSAKMVKKVSGTLKDEDFIIEALARVFINLMIFVTPTYDPVGICLDPTIAGLNHACDYNAVVSFDGPRAFVRSLCKIKRSEEITISYVDATNPFATRQAQLRDRYFFTCGCGLCKKGQDSPLDHLLPGTNERNMERIHQQELDGFQILEVVSKTKDAEKDVKDLERGMECLRATMAFPLYRQPYASLRQRLIGAYLSTQRWVPALAHALKQHFFVDPKLFPQEFHPVRMVHTWVLITLINFIRTSEPEDETTKMLAKYGVKWEAVLLMLTKEIVDNVDKSHGESSKFAAMVKKKMIELKGGEPDVSIPKGMAQDQWRKMKAIVMELAPM